MIKRILYLPAFIGYVIHILWHLGKESHSAFQDDMRQHILGLYHLSDFFGRYFSATVPLGIDWLNQVTSLFMTPLTWARWVQPIFIALLLTFFSWRLGKKFFLGGKAEKKIFLFVILLQALIWSGDDLISSTPRSWAILCVVALLDASLSRQVLRLIITLFLTALFYPPLAITGFGLFVLLQLDIFLFQKKNPLYGSNILLVIAILVGLYGMAHDQSRHLDDYGPRITKKEARVLPEFNLGGRAHYFSDDILDFWVTNSRGGLLPKDAQAAAMLLVLGLLLGLNKNSFQKLKEDRRVFWISGLFLGSLVLFFLAHAFWFRLFHPNRYIQFVIPVVACLVATQFFSKIKFVLFVLPPVLFFFNHALSNQSYYHEEEALFIKSKMAKELSPSLAVFPVSKLGEALPLLEQLPIVASEELSLPYHRAFYQKAQERLADTYSLWITTNENEVVHYFEKYQVTHILLEREAWQGKTKLSEPWQSLYHKKLVSESSSLLKQVLGKDKKKFLSKVEFFREMKQPSF